MSGSEFGGGGELAADEGSILCFMGESGLVNWCIGVFCYCVGTFDRKCHCWSRAEDLPKSNYKWCELSTNTKVDVSYIIVFT